MAWTTPMTAVTGNVFTAAQFNTHVRDNLLMTAPGIATTAANIIVTTASKVVTERIPSVEFVGTFETTTSTSYTDLTTPGPAVTVVTGTKAVIMLGAHAENTIAGLGTRMGVTISGATSSAASDTNSYYAESSNADDGFKGAWVMINSALTGGTNVFTAKYRTTAGGGTSTFGNRLMAIIPF